MKTYADECLERAGKATEEQWKDIPGAEGYQVSDFGNVRSRVRKGNNTVRLGQEYRLLKKVLRQDDRYTVSLPMGKTGDYCHKFIHYLVMLSFSGKRPDGLEIAHLNGDSTDDRLVNLKYCTHQENESHKKEHGTSPIGENNPQSKLQGWQVDEIRYLSSKSIPQGKIAKLFDIDHQLVSEIISCRTWINQTSRTDVPELCRRLKYICTQLSDMEGVLRRKMPVHPDYLKELRDELEAMPEEK
jgi:hypothetical protein